MNRQKAIAWLYGEMPQLEEAGVLPRETAAALKAHYGPITIRSRRSAALLLFSVLGAASIGLGVILLLAHNWEQLSRPMRTVLSFLPLVAGQTLAGWTLLRRPGSLAWREGSAMAMALAVGASISLISQTYQIQGSMSGFLLAWILLGGPLIHFFNASGVALLYMAGLTGWAVAAQAEGGHALLFWPLAALLAPHIWRAHKQDPEGPRMRLLSWGLCGAASIATGFVIERSMPGVWIVVYSALFSAMLLAGRGPFRAVRFNAFHIAGFIGSAALTLILTFDGVWRHVGWNHYRSGDGYHPWAAWQDYGLALALLAGAALMLVRSASRKDWIATASGGLAALAAIGFSACSMDVPSGVIIGGFNLYALFWGATILLVGLDRNELYTINAGMAVISMLIIVRFFDADLSFTVRGILFIALGIAFLGANVALVRRTATRKGAIT